MAGLWDVADWTALSESSPRLADVDTLQYHHSTVTSRAAARALYEPGGRVVSPNLQLHDGVLYGICDPYTRRAFTSGVPAQDHRSNTVETDNLTGGPDWLIGMDNHNRLAQLMVDMYRESMLGGFYYGVGGLIEHRDVPGTYATACAGPDANSFYIIERAKVLHYGSNRKDKAMRIIYDTTKGVPDDNRRYIFIPGTTWLPVTAEESLVYATLINAIEGRTVATINWNAQQIAAAKRTIVAGAGGSGASPLQVAEEVGRTLAPALADLPAKTAVATVTEFKKAGN